MGKPNPLMMRSALNAIEAHSETTAMIGDRMDTDVVAGLEAGLADDPRADGRTTRWARPSATRTGPRASSTRWPISSPSWTATVAELDGKVALVTGASGGIGAAVARSLHEAGASVGLLSRRGEDLGLERALGIACDVRDRAAVERATEQVVERFGRLDIAVANAGVGSYGPFLELDPDDLEAMIDVNLKGTLYTAAATLPHLIASGAGDFVSLASVAGVRAFPGEAVYNASKFGQVGFTRALDHELREKGVRATNIAPGGVNTEFAIGTGREHGDPVARRDDERGGRGGGRALRRDPPAQHAHPDHDLPADERGLGGLSRLERRRASASRASSASRRTSSPAGSSAAPAGTPGRPTRGSRPRRRARAPRRAAGAVRLCTSG